MFSLLPPNATRLEKALEQTAARISNLPVPFIELNRIDSCPESHLAWLAWEHRVEYWQSNWNIGQKRQAISAAKDFNAGRGTPATLKALINAVVSQDQYQLKAWHQLVPKGQPYTFTVIISEQVMLSIEQLAKLHTAIDATKSQRDLYGIDANVRTTAHFIVAGAVVSGEQVYITSQ